MVELRWLEGFVFDGDIEHAKPVRTLQYRQVVKVWISEEESYCENGHEAERWSEWKDVPVVSVEGGERG